MSEIEYTFEEARHAMEAFLNSNYSVMMRGRHGIGKSAFAYQLAEDLGLPVVERRASQMTEGDLLGLPSRTEVVDFLRQAAVALIDGDNSFFTGSGVSEKAVREILSRLEEAEHLTKETVTKFCPPDWYQTACDKPVVLFLDELDRAGLDVRQGIFELSGSRKLFGRELHPDTRIICAINGGNHSAQYQVAELGAAEQDRWMVFDIKPDVKVWLDWAAENDVAREVQDFIAENRSMLFHNGHFEKGKIYPTPRSWDRLSQTLLDMRERGVELDALQDSFIQKLAGAAVGQEASYQFRQFWADYDRVMKVEDLLAGDWDKSDFDDWEANDFANMVGKIEKEKVFAEKLEDEELESIARFFAVCKSEPAQNLITVICDSENHVDNPDGEKNVIRFMKMELKDCHGEEISVPKVMMNDVIGQIDPSVVIDEDGDE